MDIETYIEHSIPVEREIADLLFKDAVQPDLSKLRSNRKKSPRKKTTSANNTSNNKQSGSKPERPRREKGNPNRIAKKHNNSTAKHNEKSPKQREAEKLAAMEKRNKQPRKSPRIPLRGRRVQEVPAVG